jgi:hypothetical protein
VLGRDRHLRPAAIERDLARLADGTLKPSRRERVERLVESSSELQAQLEEQRLAVAATRAIVQQERAPLSLRLHSRALSQRPRRRRLVLGTGLAGAAGALVWLFAALGGSQATLTVAQAAAVAARPAVVAVAEPPDGSFTLPHLRAAGLPFPYWEDHFDWVASGARTDHVRGRILTTVFYRRGLRQVAYTIVPGRALPTVPGARMIVRSGTVVMSGMSGGERIVTWLRRGHTCVLSGHGVSLAALLKLAVWRGRGRVPF